MDQLQQISGAWIFLSHSHLDLIKVRYIRNELERMGHNPLIFFLKCLEDETALLPKLIKHEIAARNFFILCKSQNACSSQWVNEEVALIKSMEDKNFRIVDLDADLDTQLKKIEELCRRATVFISYSRSDSAIAKKIADFLIENDYSVWIEAEPKIPSGIDWGMQLIYQQIDEAALRGFVLLLLSEASLKSDWCRHETIYALQQSAESQRNNIIPVSIEKFDIASIPPELRFLHFFDMTEGPFEERLKELLRVLKTREMKIVEDTKEIVLSDCFFLEALAKQLYEFVIKDQLPHFTEKSWAEFPQENKEYYRTWARDILNLLWESGFDIRPSKTSGEIQIRFSPTEIESMAIKEHERWMREKAREGWSYDIVRDNRKKTHPCMIDWVELPEYEKNKDMEFIMNIPLILSSIGYEIIRIT